MNKVDNQEQMGGKPLGELSEEEKNTPSGMYPELNSAGDGEGDSEKKPEQTSEGETEGQTEEGEEEAPKESPEESPEQAQKSSDDTEEKEIKGLQNEENRLKQQLLENIVSLRAQRRQTTQETSQPQQTETEDEDDEMDPEVKKQMDAYLQKRGILPEAQIKEKLQQEQVTEQMNKEDRDFFNQYPEYLYSQKLRDEHDGIVNSLKPAQTAEEYKNNLKLAHQIVAQQNPDKFPSSGGADNSKRQALQTASKGTGSYSSPSSSKSTDPAKVAQAKQLLKGFSDEEIEEFMKE